MTWVSSWAVRQPRLMLNMGKLYNFLFGNSFFRFCPNSVKNSRHQHLPGPITKKIFLQGKKDWESMQGKRRAMTRVTMHVGMPLRRQNETD